MFSIVCIHNNTFIFTYSSMVDLFDPRGPVPPVETVEEEQHPVQDDGRKFYKR